jgi:sec-independent protein translocase protein TatA
MPSLGPAEILVILVVALLVFGPNKMPEIAKQVGKGFREFRRVQQHLKSELRDVVSEFDSPTSAPGPDPVPMLPPKDDAASSEPAAPPAPPEASVTEAPAAEAPAPSLPAPTPEPQVTLPTPEPDAPSEPA